jgi:predicted AAA+ superfamily ATPase
LFYWKSNNIAEVDFVLQYDTDVIPIEVKSEHNTKSKSLTEYRKRYNPRVAIKTSQVPPVALNKISSGEVRGVPLYLLWQIEKFLK